MKYLPFFEDYINNFELLDCNDHLPLLKALCEFSLHGKRKTKLSKKAEFAFRSLLKPINKSVELRKIRSEIGKKGGLNGRGISKNVGNQNARKHNIESIQNNTESNHADTTDDSIDPDGKSIANNSKTIANQKQTIAMVDGRRMTVDGRSENSGSSSTVAYGSTTVGGGGASQQPKTQIKFRKGLEWLAKFTPYKNPFDELFDTTGCLFVAAWDPRFPNEYAGCELTSEQLAPIKADPIAFAQHMIGEDGSRITRKALANRLEWIGKDHFVGEVARLWYEKSIGRDACKNAGQILLRRLEYVYGIVVGTEHHKHPVNVKILWDFAKAA